MQATASCPVDFSCRVNFRMLNVLSRKRSAQLAPRTAKRIVVMNAVAGQAAGRITEQQVNLLFGGHSLITAGRIARKRNPLIYEDTKGVKTETFQCETIAVGSGLPSNQLSGSLPTAEVMCVQILAHADPYTRSPGPQASTRGPIK
jgi:hypothetical protein